MLTGGLTPEEAQDTYGFRWHPATHRVAIPIMRNDVVAGCIMRAVNKDQKPKYLRTGPATLLWETGEGSEVVVVEDVLSAIAVARTGRRAVAVLGTAVTPELSVQIAHNAQTVVGWFDPDKAGELAWRRLRKALALYPVRVLRVQSTQDPKRCHRAEIRRLLQEATQ